MKDIRLNAHKRADGSIYITSPDFPGLHYICPEGEAPEDGLGPLLAQFIPLYYEAKLRNEKPIIRRDREHAISN